MQCRWICIAVCCGAMSMSTMQCLRANAVAMSMMQRQCLRGSAVESLASLQSQCPWHWCGRCNRSQHQQTRKRSQHRKCIGVSCIHWVLCIRVYVQIARCCNLKMLQSRDCNMLQEIATWVSCNMLQSVAVCCNLLQHVEKAHTRNLLQRIATCCNISQSLATFCNLLRVCFLKTVSSRRSAVSRQTDKHTHTRTHTHTHTRTHTHTLPCQDRCKGEWAMSRSLSLCSEYDITLLWIWYHFALNMISLCSFSFASVLTRQSVCVIFRAKW